jgi:hypothetical protein
MVKVSLGVLRMVRRVRWKAALDSESISTNASKFLPECIKDSSATADKGLCYFMASGLVVDRVLRRFLYGNGPGLGVYYVAGWYSYTFGPGLGNIADKAGRETMAGSTSPSAVASGDLFSSTDPLAVASDDLFSSADPSAVASNDLFSAASAIFCFKSSTIGSTEGGWDTSRCDTVPPLSFVAFASAANASVAASFSPGFVSFGFNSGGVPPWLSFVAMTVGME